MLSEKISMHKILSKSLKLNILPSETKIAICTLINNFLSTSGYVPSIYLFVRERRIEK